MRRQGQLVAALDLNDERLRLWQRALDAAALAAVFQAGMTLALLGDPASR
jgi:hypothetical protein